MDDGGKVVAATAANVDHEDFRGGRGKEGVNGVDFPDFVMGFLGTEGEVGVEDRLHGGVPCEDFPECAAVQVIEGCGLMTELVNAVGVEVASEVSVYGPVDHSAVKQSSEGGSSLEHMSSYHMSSPASWKEVVNCSVISLACHVSTPTSSQAAITEERKRSVRATSRQPSRRCSKPLSCRLDPHQRRI